MTKHPIRPETGGHDDYALKTRAEGVVQGFVSNNLLNSEKIPGLFRVVDVSLRLRDRPQAFRALMELQSFCADSPADMRRIAAYLVKIGECSLALNILERQRQNAPHDHGLALDIIEARIPLNKKQALAELRGLMALPRVPFDSWERASHLYEDLDDYDAALRAIDTAVAQPGAGPRTRQRLAVLLLKKRQMRRARDELVTLLAECPDDPQRLRFCCGLALRVKDRQLALRFAESQFECDPTNPEGILFLAHHVRLAGDRTRAQTLLSGLFRAERRSPSISDPQWVTLAQELFDVGDIGLTKEAVAEVKARDPYNPVARNLGAAANLLERLNKAAPLTERPAADSIPAARGFVSRLNKMFRR